MPDCAPARVPRWHGAARAGGIRRPARLNRPQARRIAAKAPGTGPPVSCSRRLPDPLQRLPAPPDRPVALDPARPAGRAWRVHAPSPLCRRARFRLDPVSCCSSWFETFWGDHSGDAAPTRPHEGSRCTPAKLKPWVVLHHKRQSQAGTGIQCAVACGASSGMPAPMVPRSSVQPLEACSFANTSASSSCSNGFCKTMWDR